MQERYKVICNFKDLEDDNYIYLKDVEDKNIYPREGLEPSKKRIKELSSEKNKIGKVLIQKIEEPTKVDEAEEVKEETEAKE